MSAGASTLAGRLSLLGHARSNHHLAASTMSPERAARGLLLRMVGDARVGWGRRCGPVAMHRLAIEE